MSQFNKITIFATNVAEHCCVFRGLPCSSLCFSLGGRFWQKLFEIFQEVGIWMKKLCHLSIDILNWLGLALICLQNLKKLFIDLGLMAIAVLLAPSG